MKKELKCDLILILLTCISVVEPFCNGLIDQYASSTYNVTYLITYDVVIPILFGILLALFFICVKNTQGSLKRCLIFMLINIVLSIFVFSVYVDICTYSLLLVGILGMNCILSTMGRRKD